MLILYKRSHVEYHGRFTARFLKRIQLGSPGLKTGLLLYFTLYYNIYIIEYCPMFEC